jgi:hypothetical protein
MHPNHSQLYYGSNLGTFRDPSPNLVLDSYYPEMDSGVQNVQNVQSSESSKLSWDSIQVCVKAILYKYHYIKHCLLQFPSSRSRSQLSMTTTSSQESFSALLQANQKLEKEKLILEAKLGALE